VTSRRCYALVGVLLAILLLIAPVATAGAVEARSWPTLRYTADGNSFLASTELPLSTVSSLALRWYVPQQRAVFQPVI
jgi:hypothetical protein